MLSSEWPVGSSRGFHSVSPLGASYWRRASLPRDPGNVLKYVRELRIAPLCGSRSVVNLSQRLHGADYEGTAAAKLQRHYVLRVLQSFDTHCKGLIDSRAVVRLWQCRRQSSTLSSSVAPLGGSHGDENFSLPMECIRHWPHAGLGRCCERTKTVVRRFGECPATAFQSI